MININIFIIKSTSDLLKTLLQHLLIHYSQNQLKLL